MTATIERAPARDATVTIRLFDADRTDRLLDLEEALELRPGEHQLLWIDIEGRPDAQTSEAIAERVALEPSTRHVLDASATRPLVALHGNYVHIRVATAVSDGRGEDRCWLDLVAAGNIALSRHDEPVELLRQLDDRIEADTTVGELDAAAFMATALDAVVTGYFRAVDEIEDAVDRLDGLALGADPRSDVPGELVAVRRRIARLRRGLSAEREVFAALATPDFRAAAAGEDGEAFGAVAARFESALDRVENSRELLLGSFDVFMIRTAQRTNDTMKVLALATVLLLPGSLIAALLGMNVTVPLAKDDPLSFWLVVVAIVTLATGMLLLARSRRWI